MLDYVSGLASEFILLPMTVVIRKLQCKSDAHNKSIWKNSFFNAISHIWRTEGLIGLYSGLQYHVVDGLIIYFGTMAFFVLVRALLLFFKDTTLPPSDEDSNKKG